MAIGITFELILDGLTTVSLIQGIISTGLAVTTYQTIKQTKEGINSR